MHPEDRSATIYRLDNLADGKPLVFDTKDECGPAAVPDLILNVAAVFSDLPPREGYA